MEYFFSRNLFTEGCYIMKSFPSLNLGQRLAYQREFFRERKGNLLIFAEFTQGRRQGGYVIEGQGPVLSEDFLSKHAYDLGVQRIRNVKAAVVDQMEVGDDSVPYPGFAPLTIDWGTGATAALFTGGDVIFQEGTSYSAAPVIHSWDKLEGLKLNLDNRWVEYELECWRGMLSEYAENLPIATHMFRSPLDLANDLRGNEIFVDLYDHPEEVKRLLDMCANAIIECDEIFRERLPQLNNLPGGVWGVALPEPGMIFLNGDPIDLISEEMGEIFNRPYVEKIIASAGSLYLHHHSIGVSRAQKVSRIKGLTVQEIIQDPNGPRLVDYITDDLITASLETPIDFGVYGLNREVKDLDAILERLSEGRFIVRMIAETAPEAQRLVEKARSLI